VRGERYPFGLQPREPCHPANAPRRSARGARPDQGSARSSMTFCPCVRTRPPSSPATTRRSSANARQRAGASQRKVAMSAGVKRRYPFELPPPGGAIAHFLLHAAGVQQENGLGAFRWPTGDFASRLDRCAEDCVSAGGMPASAPAPSPLANCKVSRQQDLACRPQDRCAEDCASPRLFPSCQRVEAGTGSGGQGALKPPPWAVNLRPKNSSWSPAARRRRMRRRFSCS
jgi:hypothetical protein